MSYSEQTTGAQHLHLRRLVPASPERVFDAWTNPDELKQWWGPKDVRCVSAEVELREGGLYRIANELPDGSVLWIAGEFKRIDKPNLLVYTWAVSTANPSSENPHCEQVSVHFEAHEQGTEIVLTHERIQSTALRDQHERGWIGCLDGLEEFLD